MKYDAMAIGNRAFEARKKKNLKQYDISSALGIHQATYSKFENGRYDMPVSELLKLCKILDISISWLVGEKVVPDLTDSESLEVEKYMQYIISIRNKQ